MARYFSSAQGRFTSPDPLLASALLTDPQTWNRYAYVRNDPVNLVDPDGRAVIDPNAYQFYQSQFLTGNEFNSWFNQVSISMIIDGFSRDFDQVNRWLGRNPLKYLD